MILRFTIICFLLLDVLCLTSGQDFSTQLIVTELHQDSLVDVFPLSVGNKWQYQYYYHYYFYKPPNWIDDTGKVEIEVTGKTVLKDTIVWQIQHHKISRYHFVSPYEGKGIDTSYDIDEVSTSNLYELQSGQHLLFTDYCYSGIFLCSAETAKVFRFQMTDSSGNVVVGTSYFPSPRYSHRLIFHEYIGLLSDSLYVNVGSTEIRNLTLLSSTIVSVNESKQTLPKEMRLLQNYPNPFNPVTTIGYSILGNEFVSLKIYNMLGQEIAILVNEKKSPGVYTVQWNASKLPSGVYFYQLRAGTISQAKNLLLLK